MRSASFRSRGRNSVRYESWLILSELKKENVKEPEPVKPITVDQLFQDPDSAIRQTVASSDVAKRADEAVQKVEELERGLAMRTFESSHPSWKNDLTDPTFREWVASNQARVELFRRGDQYDSTAAKSLWDMWGEYKELKEVHDKREEAKVRRKENLNAVKTVSESGGSAVPSGGPVYSRAKLMELQIRAQSGDILARNKLEDPAFQSEMLKAYQEKRIR